MTWAWAIATGLGWALAAGLYLQLRDALRLAKSWRETAIVEGKRAQANLNLAEFAVRQLPHPAPSTGTLRAVDDA